MNILHILPSLKPVYGGTVECAKQMASGLSSFGVRSDFLVFLDTVEDTLNHNLKYEIYSFGPSLGFYGFNLKAFMWLRANYGVYDKIIVHGIWQFHSLACLIATPKVAKKNIVLFPHGMLGTYFNKNKFKYLKKLIYWLLFERHFFSSVASVFFTTVGELEDARRSFLFYKARNTVVGMGIEGFSALENKIDDLNTLGAHDDVFLFLGRLSPVKGCDNLLRGFSSIYSGTNVLLIMAGPGEDGYRKFLVDLTEKLGISRQVIWTGMLNNEEKWSYISAASALVLMSHHENFGVVVAEALSASKPVLITNKVKIHKQISDDNCGFVSNDTFEGAVELFSKWKDMTFGQRAVMRKNARLSFVKNYSLDVFIKKIRNLLDC